MHRVILELKDPKIEGDHIDSNGLNNQRYNLRPATKSQNMCNKRRVKANSSQYKGVIRSSKGRCVYWVPKIRVNGKRITLGHFKDEKLAALAYDEAAKRLHGEFANINFK